MNEQQNSTKNFIRGGQITLHYLRMFNQIANKVFLVGFLGFILFLVGWFFVWSSAYERYVLGQWVAAHLHTLIGGQNATQALIQPDGTQALVYSAAFLNSSLLHSYLHTAQMIFFSGLVAALFLALALTWGISRYLRKRGKKHTEDKRVKGDYLVSPEELKEAIIEADKDSDITLGKAQLPLIRYSEKQHLLVDGTTGAGKSNAIKELLMMIRSRGERVIIWDEGGNYFKNFYEPSKDCLLNALDSRGFSWHLWNECEDIADFENIAEALIPMMGVQDPFWVLGARTIFSEVAFAMRNDPDRSVKKLLTMLLTTSLENIKAILQNTYASTLVNEKIEKTAISIKAVMAAFLKCLRYVKDEDNAFSIRKWVQDDTTSQWLFISSVAKKHAALKPLITAWLDIAINELLSLPENENRRVWIILDELTSLHKLPTLFPVLSKSRKAGGCVVIGNQNHAQLADIYGTNGAKIISSLLNTRLLFRQPDPDLAAWSAKNLGDTVMDEVREGLSYGANTMRDGVSINRVETRKALINPSEIMTLDNLQCLVRFPGKFPVTQLNFDYHDLANRHEPFIPRSLESDDKALDELIKTHDKPWLVFQGDSESDEHASVEHKAGTEQSIKKASVNTPSNTKATDVLDISYQDF